MTRKGGTNYRSVIIHGHTGRVGFRKGTSWGAASFGRQFLNMRKLIAPVAALAFLAGGTTVATALPGPNDHNTFGLCTAYFAGSEQGQEQKRKAPPFQGLEAAAEASDQTVEEYCAENGTHPSGKK